MLDSGKLMDFAPGGGVAAGAFAERFDSGGWIDVPVPGDVHRALIAAGRVEDPFYDRNEGKCVWMEGREWWYRLSFEGPREPLGQDERLLLWPDPVFCTSCYESVSTDSRSSGFPPSSILLSRSAASANCAGVW